MKNLKKLFALLFSLLMLLSLAACGGSASESSRRSEKAAPQSASYARDEMTAEYEMPAADFDYAYAETGESYGGFAAEKTAKPDGEAPAIDPEKIIYSASATVETTDYELTLERLNTLVREEGGFIESSSVNGSNYEELARGHRGGRSASYTLRVPSDRFQTLMGSLSALGNVPYSHTYTENISAAYYDVEARLTAYRTQEQRLLEMMALAETVSDVIVIEDRLAGLRYQIESLQSTLKNWDRQVSYSSIYLEVREVSVYTPETTLSYGEQLALALTTGLTAVGEFFENFLLGFVEALPALLILAVLALIVVLIVRGSLRRRRAKKAAAEKRAE